MADFEQLEGRQIAVNKEIVDALNDELKRLGCSVFSVQVSSNQRLGSVSHAMDTSEASKRVDNFLIDPIETLRILIDEAPIPTDMDGEDKTAWVFRRLVEAEWQLHGECYEEAHQGLSF